MNEQKERESFEKWAVKYHGNRTLSDPDAGSMWTAWLARAALAHPPVEPHTSERFKLAEHRLTALLVQALGVKAEAIDDLAVILLTAKSTQEDQAALRGKAGVPDGWQLVPKEPTTEMLAAVRNGPMHETWAAGYRAMLAAAPKAAQDHLKASTGEQK